MKSDRERLKKRMGELFYAQRTAAGMGQVEFAQKLGVSQSLISKIEHAMMPPDLFLWLRFCQIFGHAPDLAMREATFSDTMAGLREEIEGKAKASDRKTSSRRRLRYRAG